MSRYLHEFQMLIYQTREVMERPQPGGESAELSDAVLKKLDEISARFTTVVKPELKPAIAMLSPSEHQIASPNRQFIREISHALNTPISYIEVLLEAAAATTENTPELTNLISELQSSINICKAYLASFRGLTLISAASSLWSPTSLNAAIESAFAVYTKAAVQELSLAATLPERISGYANHLIVSIMLPLIENAIDASPPRSTIDIRYQQNNGTVAIIITNATVSIPTPEILEDGFSTNPGHDGLGLTIVRHLLSTITGANLLFDVDAQSKKVTFTVSLPMEAKE